MGLSIDRENVIEGLKKVWDAFNHMEHELYADYVYDALALLKEQEAKQVNISQAHYGIKYGLCPCCGKQVDTFVNPHYCGNCGQAVKWDE